MSLSLLFDIITLVSKKGLFDNSFFHYFTRATILFFKGY